MAGDAIDERQIMTEYTGLTHHAYQRQSARTTEDMQILPAPAKTAKKLPYNLGLVPR
jgi:hypothetical protein